MLHANHSRKSRLPFLRYVANANEQSHRRTQEDEITSIVFGPLDFMPEASVKRILAALFGSEPIPEDHRVSIMLWPRYGNVEPDVVFIEQLEAERNRAYVLEIKWNAPLGDDQVDRQRAAVRDSNIDLMGHIVLSRYPIEVDSNSKNLTWMDFNDSILQVLRNDRRDTIAKRWAELAWSFLESCNVRHFAGFSNFPGCPDESEQSGNRIFWSGPINWDNLDLPSASFLSRCNREAVFYPSV